VSSAGVRRVRPAVAALAAAAGVLVTVAGCSSSGSSAASSSASPAPSATTAASAAAGPTASASASAAALPTVSMTPLAAASGQLTGTELESVLLPETDFPSGFATSTSGPVTSGGSLTSGAATYNLATISCATFVEHLGATGFGESAMVSGSVVTTLTTGQAYDQVIYQFPAASGASGFLSGVQALGGRCASFKVKANGVTGTFSLHTAAGSPVGGHPTVELQETGTLGEKVDLDMLLCASGVDVFAAAGVGVSGAAAPTAPAAETIVYELMKRQAAEAVLG
jgi:hypothetical protein